MSEDFTLSQKERDALMENVYGGFQRSPEIQTWGRGSEWNPRHRNAGKIDYAAYGGEAKNYADKRALRGRQYGKERGYDDYKYEGKKEYYGDAWRNRDTWGKVAKHLGIDKVDDEGDLRKMYDFVRGYEAKEKDDDTETETTEPIGPNIDRPDQVKNAQDLFNETKLDNPGNQPGAGSARTGLADANMAAIRGGDDLNEWYQTKFVPHLEADANATNSEQGDDSRYFLDKFAFEPPKLGNVKTLFDKYKGEIEELD